MSSVKSGLKISEEVMEIKEMISQKKLSGCRFMLNKAKTEIIKEPDSEVSSDCKHPYRQICKGFTKDNVRFALVNIEIRDIENVGDLKFGLIYWCSDDAPLKEKMTATSSVDAVKAAFGLTKHVELHDDADKEPETIIGKFLNVGKKVQIFDGRNVKQDPKKKAYVYDGHATSSEDEA